MRPHSIAGCAAAGALLGAAAAVLNGTPLLGGVTGGLLVGELVALLAPRDEDDGGLGEPVAEPVAEPMLDPAVAHG
jgi:hypothetical protein